MSTDGIISKALQNLQDAGYTPKSGHVKTGDIRKVSAVLYREINDVSIGGIFDICGGLLERLDWRLNVIAFDFAYRPRRQYGGGTFDVFESWLEKYVRGWGDCDDFCSHAFGELIIQYAVAAAAGSANSAKSAALTDYAGISERIAAWTRRDEFWMRRAAAVILIPAIRRGMYNELRPKPLDIADALLRDSHYLVLKGYGWMLKTLSTKEPELVFNYLRERKADMPGLAFRYALEKFDPARKQALQKRR